MGVLTAQDKARAPASSTRAGTALRPLTAYTTYIGPLLALGSLVLYARTVAPSLGGTTDSSEFQAASYSLSIVHSTGYPLYLLLGRLWISIFPFGDPAFRLNFLSAVFAAGAVWVLYALARQVTGSAWAALAAAALFSMQAIPWSQASVAEVNSLNTLLTGLAFLAVVKWSDGEWPLYIAALAYGLALSHHRTAVLYAPCLIIFAFIVSRRASFKPVMRRAWLLSALLLLLPFALYVYIPLRAFTTPSYENNLHGFLNLVVGQSALPLLESTLRLPLVPRFKYLFDLIFQGRVGWVLLLLGLLGIGLPVYAAVQAIRQRRAIRVGATRVPPPRDLHVLALALCLAAFIIGSVFDILYDIIDISDYLAVPIFFWCVLVAAGILALGKLLVALLAKPLPSRVAKPLAAGIIAAGVMLLFLFTAASSLARQDVRVDYSQLDRQSYWQQAQAALQNAPLNSILIGVPPELGEAQYLQRVQGWRPDLSTQLLDDTLFNNTAPVSEWLKEKRGVYMLGQFDEIASRYGVEQAGPIWRVAGTKDASAAPPAMSHRVDWQLANNIMLEGYTLDPDAGSVQAGASLKITLYWRATGRIYERYTVFNHVIDSAGNKVGQKDDEPRQGYKPTAKWHAGEQIIDTMTVPISPNAKPGMYRLIVGMYNSVTQQRVPVTTPNGQSLGDYAQLAELTIVGH